MKTLIASFLIYLQNSEIFVLYNQCFFSTINPKTAGGAGGAGWGQLEPTPRSVGF